MCQRLWGDHYLAQRKLRLCGFSIRRGVIHFVSPVEGLCFRTLFKRVSRSDKPEPIHVAVRGAVELLAARVASGIRSVPVLGQEGSFPAMKQGQCLR